MTRRAALARLALGLGGIAGGLPAAARAGAPERLRFADLYAGGGPLGLTFSDAARRLRGQPVAMRGFLAPPLKPEAGFFVLAARPVSLCPFCQSDADWPHDIVVVYLHPGSEFRFRSSADPLEVTGVLELGSRTDPETGFVSQVRLVGSHARLL